MIGSDAIVEMLIRLGVEDVFGVPGDTSMNFHDAFARNIGKINHIVCRDERNAAYMADGYAKIKGKPGVVEVPSGGGALYAVPGVSEANESYIPLVCICSDITMSSEETGALTDVDQVHLFKSITKWNTKIRLASKIPDVMRKAFRMAVSGRPGAVHISIPENIHGQEITFTPEELAGADFTCHTSSVRTHPCPEDIEKVSTLLSRAKRPVIIAGGGVHLSGAYEELESFIHNCQVPVATTVNGKGSIGEMSPLAIGVIGANGGADETNQVVKEADLVLVLGSKLNNVTTVGKDIFSGKPIVIQVDINEEMIDANIRVALPVMSDIRTFLTDFTAAIQRGRIETAQGLLQWNARVQELIQEKQGRIAQENSKTGELVNPAKIFSILEKITDENTIYTADAGTPTPYLAAHLRLKKAGRHTVLTRSHGSLGYALPAAIGAKVAKPEATVISMFGDGSFGMAVGDLETAARIGLPVIFINFQNNSYGWIKTIQNLYYKENYMAVDFTHIDAVKIAEGFGVRGKRIDKDSELESGLRWALEQKQPVLLDIMIEPPTSVIPPVVKWLKDAKVAPENRKKLTY
ncbi:MAG: thiamine pyrophosphate-binding protein [Dethiobacter sp.]|jgi:acetolactate synthase-1/2/3 large subunit|nr:thiamine pyrophosphate-binding protein [Dethiobacter sp.]